jgi:hypothetical protein
MSVINVVWCAWLLVPAAASCGPELTEPASTNITGRWTSADLIGPLSDISMELTQAPDGGVQGEWAGVGSPPDPVCPPQLGSAPRGRVAGSNTVLELRLSLIGAGEFSGQVRGDEIKGSFASCNITYSITFSRELPLQ